MEDWILEGSKSITLLSQKYIIGSAAIIEDRLSLRLINENKMKIKMKIEETYV